MGSLRDAEKRAECVVWPNFCSGNKEEKQQKYLKQPICGSKYFVVFACEKKPLKMSH